MDLMEWKMNQMLLGDWKCVWVDDGEAKGAPEEGEMFVMHLAENGKGQVTVDGESGDMEWHLVKEDDMWILETSAAERAYIVKSIEGDKMVWEIEDTTIELHFERTI